MSNELRTVNFFKIVLCDLIYGHFFFFCFLQFSPQIWKIPCFSWHDYTGITQRLKDSIVLVIDSNFQNRFNSTEIILLLLRLRILFHFW